MQWQLLTDSVEKEILSFVCLRRLVYGDLFVSYPCDNIFSQNIFLTCENGHNCVRMVFMFVFFFILQDGEIDLKLLTNVLSPETEVFEVGLYKKICHAF